MENLQFTSARERKDFEEWLTTTPFYPDKDNSLLSQEQIDWNTVLQLYHDYQERRREGWYCSFEDAYGDILRQMRGVPPREEEPLEKLLEEACDLYCFGNRRIGASKIMQLARKGYA